MNKNKYAPRYTRPKLSQAIQHAGSLVDEVHKMCKSLPPISPQDFDNLADSIKENGLLDPLCVNHEKQLLDGRSRLMACFAAGVPVTADDIKVTDHCPEAIAQSNVARRHLAKDQKLMMAVDRLAQQREKAADRKAAAAEKGRKNRATPDLAKRARSQAKKRGKPVIETVAKEESVPREELALAEKVVKTAPELRSEIESGAMTLDQAAERAGISRKQPKTTKRKKSEPARRKRNDGTATNQAANAEQGVATEHGAFIEHGDDIREYKAPGVSVFSHHRLEASVLVYGIDGNLFVGATDDDDHYSANLDGVNPPIQQGINYLKQKLKQIR